MKKNLLGWLAMATMLVGTGCSSDEVVNDYSPENAIQFGTYVGRDAQGRASVIDDTNLGTLGFGVYAYYTDGASFNESSSTPNFMRNQKVEKTIDGWVYDPLKYWPNESTDKLSFFAYAPYQGTGDAENNLTLSQITNGGIPKVVFSLNQDVEKQEDLLWAIPHLNVQKQNVNSDIKFALKHALSRIGFDAEVMVNEVNGDVTGAVNDASTQPAVGLDEKTTITINSVKIHARFTNGTLNLMDGSWTIADGDKPSSAKTLVLGTSNFVENSNVFKSTDNNNKRKLNADDSYIMIVPQDFTDVENNGAVQIEVNYTVKTEDLSLATGSSEITNNISDAFAINFEQGKAYKFTLHLGMTSVKVSATVQTWNDLHEKNDIAVNVPLN